MVHKKSIIAPIFPKLNSGQEIREVDYSCDQLADDYLLLQQSCCGETVNVVGSSLRLWLTLGDEANKFGEDIMILTAV